MMSPTPVICLVGAFLHTLAQAGDFANNVDVDKHVTVPYTEQMVRIDGRLDEYAWRRAVPVSDLTQFLPGDGTLPSEPTEVSLLRDDNYLYIGARLGATDPSTITMSQLVQGQQVNHDDFFRIDIDPFNTGRSGYVFFVNPNGIQRDGLIVSGGEARYNMDWNGIWRANAQVDEDGWTVEVALPYKTLSFNPQSDAWGINFIRAIQGTGERIAWRHRNHGVSIEYSGTIHGMGSASQGLGLDVVLSAALKSMGKPGGSAEHPFKPSLDVFYRITPALTSSFTFNTDFSASAVDDRQVNLTRFSMFVPEKRAFFLEGTTIFDFGSIQENARPFFSRTIGRSASGHPIHLDVGAKLTGRVDRFTIGTLAVRQDSFEGLDEQSLFVGRAFANVLDQSTIGGIVTVGDPASEVDNHLFGVDFNYRDWQTLDGRLLDGGLWIQRTHTDGPIGDAMAYGVRFGYPNDRIDTGFEYTEIQENFNPAMGFVNRAGIRQYDARYKYRHRFSDSRFRSWEFGIEYLRIDNLDNELETERVSFTPLLIDTNSGEGVSLQFFKHREVLNQPFELPGGIVLAADQYDFERVRLSVETAQRRRFALELEGEAGEFFDGRRLDAAITGYWNPNSHVDLSVRYEANRLKLSSGDFTIHTSALTANFASSKAWAWLNVAQYDNVSRSLGWNSRIRWMPALGRVAYLVLNYGWEEDATGRFMSTSRDMTLKFSYTFRW